MMKNIKKYILLPALILALCCICACGESPEPAETPVVTVTPTPTPRPLPQFVCINEVMASNKSTLADESGLFPDWLELYNYGSESADLSGCYLNCGASSWLIESLTLAPNEYKLIFCSKDESTQPLHADFGISSEGETVSLSAWDGTVIDSFSVPASEADKSFYRNDSGELVNSAYPTPGYENTLVGYSAFQSSRVSTSPLVINEAMTYNNSFLRQNGEYYDWVELKNVSDRPVELSDYYLSDSGSERAKYQLPQGTLEAGQFYIVYCTGDSSANVNSANAPFALSSEKDELFLSYKDGTLCDYTNLYDLRLGGSYGRVEGLNGFCYIDTPTPLKQNSSGAYSIAPKPVLIGEDGVYDDVESVSVTLSAEGSIYYTTDGSVPTVASTPYTEPITLSQTTAIRAVNIMEGSLVSDTLNICYIINEGHDLPVVSLVSAPDNLTGSTGIYSNPTADWERPCSITLYDGEEGFSIEGGMKMHGATSRVAQSKKSFKINFRPRYEGELQYDLFGNDVTQFSSILLRSAQEDTFSTQIRDNLMHQLAIKACPELPSQDYKYCVLYINGQYWGLYNIREAHSTAHYANHYGYSEESVSMWKEAWPADSSFSQVYWFMMNNDMREDENYDYVAQHIDIESLIAWVIIEAYSGNLDCNSPNVRFYYSSEDDMLRFALVDLDLGMFDYNTFGIPLYTGYAFNNVPARLLDNDKFRVQFLTQLSEYLNGPLANENVLSILDDLQSQIRSEIPRDRERWGGSLYNWEHMLNNYLYPFVRDYGGRAKQLANSVRSYVRMTQEEYEQYFGNVQ